MGAVLGLCSNMVYLKELSTSFHTFEVSKKAYDLTPMFI
jgi:hypothetical protein